MSKLPKRPTDETEIGAWRATLHALTGRSISHFPRVLDPDGSWTTIDDSELIDKAAVTLKDLSQSDDGLDAVIGHARETLDEVKELTDYEDNKATRLLTIIAFLSALTGILFGKLADLYPLHALFNRAGEVWWHLGLVCLAYIGFAAFAVLAVCGAMVTFHALRLRFRYPKPSLDGRAKSFLFYRGILEVPPGEWARSYLAADNRTKLASDIRFRYFQNYVVESYLIAAKVADKVRYLVPAQSMLANATRVLVLWLLVYAITLALVPPVEKGAIAGLVPVTAASAAGPSLPNP